MDNNNKNPMVLFKFNNHVKPVIKEDKNNDWVLNGKDNSYFKYVNDRYIGSPTNSAINNGYCRLIYGQGLAARNQSENPTDYAKLKTILKKKDVKRLVKDFQVQGMAYIEVIYNRDKSLSSLSHISVEKIAPFVANADNEIEGYWFSNDWKNRFAAENDPIQIPAFGTSREGREIYAIRPYQMGMEYFTLPSYQSGLESAELEEEISHFLISLMKNGMSAGYVINVPDTFNLTKEEKDEVERKIKDQLTGSDKAGTVIVNFANGEKSISVDVLEITDAHDKWEFASKESQNKLLVAHEVVSPLLFGIKDASGFSSNADELDIAEVQTLKRVIKPKQDEITDAIEDILIANDIHLDLYFKPLTEEKETVIEEQTTELSKICCSKDEGLLNIAEELIKLGEDIPDDWVELDSRVVESHTLTEDIINNKISLARVPTSSPSANSEQDTSLFKIRYQYKGSGKGEREFCNKVIQANKVYTVEALNRASKIPVNKGFGANGSDTYDIFLYKGGVNCKHFWERKIFLKSNNEQISVNQARKMILELEPEERADARWETNPPEVAQVAQPSNNFWRLYKHIEKLWK